LSTVGCSAVTGRFGIMVWTFCWTSLNATSTSFSRTNWTNTRDAPSIEDERSSSIPLMVLTASSTFSVISVSISSGDAPGLITVTVSVGKSIFGNRSTPRLMNENAPTTTSERISIVAKTGRLTQISANHCIDFLVQGSRIKFQGSLVTLNLEPNLLDDKNSVRKLFQVARGDDVAIYHSAFYLDICVFEQPQLHDLFAG